MRQYRQMCAQGAWRSSKDIVVIPINAFLLAQHLPDAQLVMYPDAGHGAQSQHAEVFLEHARLFLNG
jgi:pimeloyl-ACP methyl ester carboxylesterase